MSTHHRCNLCGTHFDAEHSTLLGVRHTEVFDGPNGERRAALEWTPPEEVLSRLCIPCFWAVRLAPYPWPMREEA